MGSKFCNLNVYGGDLAAVESLCPDFAVRSLVPGWVTVASESLAWGETQKAAARLSKALPVPVLSTEYFDDDYVEFALFQSGRRAARHVPAEFEAFRRIPGKSKAWAEVLGLSEENENLLPLVFKETDPETSLHLLECVLGCPLWVDAEWMDDAALPTKDYLENYLSKKREKKRIRSRTKLTLLDEITGDFDGSYPLIKREAESGQFSFWDIQDGKFRKLFQKEYPDILPQMASYRSPGQTESALLMHGSWFHNGKSGRFAQAFSEEGEVLDQWFCEGDEEGVSPYISLLDQDRTYDEGVCRNFRTHKVDWDLGLARDYTAIYTPLRFADGRLVIAYSKKQSLQSEFLMSFRPDGSDRVVREVPYGQYVYGQCWDSPIVSGDKLYYGSGKRIFCCNSLLEELWAIEIDEPIGYSRPHLDEITQTLYLPHLHDLLALDLKTKKIRAKAASIPVKYLIILGILPGVGPILRMGDSTIQVWNSDLEPVSSHRTKGSVGKIISQDGRIYLRTHQKEGYRIQWTNGEPEYIVTRPACLRLYELTMK